jgi:hypothetical protein
LAGEKIPRAPSTKVSEGPGAPGRRAETVDLGFDALAAAPRGPGALWRAASAGEEIPAVSSAEVPEGSGAPSA